MKILDEYFAMQKKIYEYFGYVEDWVVIPLDDSREFYWHLTGYKLYFSKEKDFYVLSSTEEGIFDDDIEYYSNEVYTQRFLDRYVYCGEEYTMICVDTGTDGNKFLQIFDNAKEIKD